MNHSPTHFLWRSGKSGGRLRGPHAFSLLEILVAMTIAAIVAIMAFVALVAVLRGVSHAEAVVNGTTEVRYASDMISQTVRGASRPPLVQSGGCDLIVAPYDLGYAVVEAVTWIDTVHNTKGSKANQRVLKLSNLTPAAVASTVFISGARPPGAVSADEVSTYFKNSSELRTVDLNDLFAVDGVITIPATAYGVATERIINSISNNPGSKTLTATTNLGVNVPNGTKILASNGRRVLFRITADGDLRYYPDNRDMDRFSILATDINPLPLSVPSTASSSTTEPFSLVGNYLSINLQKVPRGTVAGRTLQGFQTSVYVRTDPLVP